MGDDEALAAKSSWLPAIPGHCVCFMGEQRAHSVNRCLLLPGLVSLNLSLSCVTDHLGCFPWVLCSVSLPVHDRTGGGDIFNHKCEMGKRVNTFSVFLTITPLPTLAPNPRAANEERTVPHASAINAAEYGSVNFHTSHLKLSCFLHR